MAPKFWIQLASNQTYCPGTAVTGSLLLDVDKPKSYKQILVQLSGRSFVHLRVSLTGLTGGYYTSLEPYFDSVAPLWDSRQSPDGKLPPGQYNWPFSFVIPPSVPSSFEGKLGNIRYMLVGRIVTGALKHNHDVMTLIPVQQLVQITDPRLLQPVRTEVQKTVGWLFSTSQPIIMSVAVPKTGFFIGESFQLQISLENGSKRRVSLTATLKEYVTFSASGSSRKISRSLYAIRTNRVERQQTEHLDKTIMVPLTGVDIVHKSSCRNITVTYCIKVTCHIPRAFNLSTTIPLELTNCR
jgi:hypothetical protein